MEPELATIGESRTHLSKATAFGILGVLALAVAGAYYYWIMPMQLEAEKERYKAAYETLHEPHHSGDLDTSITVGKELLAQAPTPTWAAQTQLIIANDLYTRNKDGDRAEAYAMYKSIVADTQVHPLHRALALAEMAFNAQMAGDETFASTYIFNDEPYAGMLAAAGGDTVKALQSVYAWSDTIYPNAFAKIQTAVLLGQEMNSDNFPQASREEHAREMQANVRAAEPLLGIEYDPSRRAGLYLSSANALWMSSKVLDTVSRAEIDEALRKARATASGDSTAHGGMIVYLTRIFGAVVAHDAGDEAAAVQDLTSLSRDVLSDSSAAGRYTKGFLSSVFARNPGDLMRARLLQLAGMSPEFKSLLASSGWSF